VDQRKSSLTFGSDSEHILDILIIACLLVGQQYMTIQDTT